MLPASQLSPLTSLLPNPNVVEDVISSACTFALWHTMSGNQSASQLTCDKLQLYFLQRNQKGTSAGSAPVVQQPSGVLKPPPHVAVPKKDIMSSIRSHRRESGRVDEGRASGGAATSALDDTSISATDATPQRDINNGSQHHDAAALSPANMSVQVAGLDDTSAKSECDLNPLALATPSQQCTSSPTDGEQACAMESLLESIEEDAAPDVSAILYDDDAIATQQGEASPIAAVLPQAAVPTPNRVPSQSQEIHPCGDGTPSLHQSRSVVEVTSPAQDVDTFSSTLMQTTPVTRSLYSHSTEPQAATPRDDTFHPSMKRMRDDEPREISSGNDVNVSNHFDDPKSHNQIKATFTSPSAVSLAPSPQQALRSLVGSSISSATLSASLFTLGVLPQQGQFITQQVALPRRGTSSSLVPNYLRPTRSQAASSQSAYIPTVVEFAQPPGINTSSAPVPSQARPTTVSSKPNGKGTPPPQGGSQTANSKKKYQAPSSHLR